MRLCGALVLAVLLVGPAARSEPAAGVEVPFELLGNAIYVSAKVNGRGPFLLAVDTGSCCALFASELVDELGMKPEGQSTGIGAGSSSNKTQIVRGKIEYTLAPGLVLATDDANTVSMAALWPLPGRKFYGDIGYDTLKDYLVRFDYQRRVATFFSPSIDVPSKGGEAFGATMMMSYDPQIGGSFSVHGLPAVATRFTLDTGAGGTIINAALVKKYKLLQRIKKKLASPSHGIGEGTSNDVVGRIDALALGSYTLKKPLVALSQDEQGSLANGAIGVNLGGNILRRFTVTIDYPKRIVTLEPNAQFAEPFLADASGLVLTARGEDFRTFVISSVLSDSPAAEAKLQPGDQITQIDGKPAASYALWELIDLLKTSGRHLPITVLRDGNTINCELVLRALA